MKVLHINTHVNGGAAIAVRRIHQGLVGAGLKSNVFHRYGSIEDSSYFNLRVSWWDRLIRKLDHVTGRRSVIFRSKAQRQAAYFLDEKPEGFELFSPAQSDQKVRFNDLPVRPDIIHLHWIAGFFDYASFFESIPDDIPIVWTLHDMNPFTGGCHYSWECKGYIEKCGNCPQLANSGDHDLSRQVIEEKKHLLSDKSIHVVADSHWLESLARRSSVFRYAASVRTIHYGLEIQALAPKEKMSCRQTLGISPDEKVILFGADNVEDKRKGLAELVAAIRLLKKWNENVFLLIFGLGSGLSLYKGERVKHLGYIQSLEMQSTAYSAADVFVMPSLYEAFGQVALEAMSCGVPVVSFDNGGASDMVINGVTGFLAKRGDSVDLATMLSKVLSDEVKGREMGNNAREMVLKQFTINQQATKYMSLYEEIHTET